MSKDRLNSCASLMSSLTVATVVVIGLASLCAQNLSGSVGARHLNEDHSTAVHKLLFRG